MPWAWQKQANKKLALLAHFDLGPCGFCHCGPWFDKDYQRSSHYGSVVKNPTSIHEDMDSIPGLIQWVKDLALP